MKPVYQASSGLFGFAYGRGWVIKAAVGAIFTFSTTTLLSAGAASAAVIPGICNTGLTAFCSGGPTGTLATPGSLGPADPTWELGTSVLPSGPAPLTPPGTFTPSTAFVNIPDSSWLSNGPFSQWITPRTETSDGGLYFYRDNFTIPIGDNPLTAEINGIFSTDNEGLAVYLNGIQVLTGVTFPGALGFSTFSGDFIITSANATFNSGANTLDFLVRNRGVGGIDTDPTDTGLRVEFNSDSVSVVPEPSTLALLAAALAGFGWIQRAKRPRLGGRNRDHDTRVVNEI